MVLQYERQNDSTYSDESKVLINNTERKTSQTKNKSNSFSSRHKRFCTFCHRSNHTVESCFKKHRVSPYIQKRHIGSANHVLEGSDSTDEQSNDEKGACNSPTSSNSGVAHITQDQFDKLMHLLQNSNLNHGPTQAISNQEQTSIRMIGSTSRIDGLCHHGRGLVR